MTRIRVKIAGVPEHFNLPWKLAIEKGLFLKAGIDLIWSDYPEGTGAMCKALQNNETDLALILTEGTVANAINTDSFKIVQHYVESPLMWGIHTGANSPYTDASQLAGTRFAISRYTSGSHLMAYVFAQQQGWNPQEIKFEIIHNLEGARKSLTALESDAFMWDRFMTSPYVASGELRRIGVCPTPWPCFMLAVSNTFSDNNAEDVKNIARIISEFCATFKSVEGIKEEIVNRYQLAPKEVEEWFRITEWSTQSTLDKKMLKGVQQTLLDLGVIKALKPVDEICFKM